jgi:hypothetical protein
MENRKAHRVVFERGYAVNMMAIDGTWRRPCTMEDVSDTGARLTIDGSIESTHQRMVTGLNPLHHPPISVGH